VLFASTETARATSSVGIIHGFGVSCQKVLLHSQPCQIGRSSCAAASNIASLWIANCLKHRELKRNFEVGPPSAKHGFALYSER
jgi:hypothetical protein